MTGNLRSEANSSFGARRSAAAALLVTGLPRKDNHGVAGVEEHRGVEYDILVHTQGHFGQCVGDESRVGHGLKQVSADGIKKFDLTSMRGFDHLHDFKARIGRSRVMPEIRETAGGVVVDRKSAGKFIGLRAALASSLHSAMAADRHDATLFTTQHATRESEIDNRLDIIDAEFMLREADAVDDHCGARTRV